MGVPDDELLDATTALAGAMAKELESIARLNSFQVLGVDYEADDAEVLAAYTDLIARYHPDRYLQVASDELRRIAAEMHLLIVHAFHELGGAEARARTKAALGTRRAPVPARRPPPRRLEEVPTRPSARYGERPPQRELDPDTVRAPVVLPVQAFRDDVVRATDHLTAEAALEAGHVDEALRYFRLQARLHPDDIRALVGMSLCEGTRALAARDRLGAAQHFEAALELDPLNESAARQLAEMRRQATNERRTALAKIIDGR